VREREIERNTHTERKRKREREERKGERELNSYVIIGLSLCGIRAFPYHLSTSFYFLDFSMLKKGKHGFM
jgi:hypothetical protein